MCLRMCIYQMAKWTLSGYEFDALICIQTCDFQSTVHRRQRPRRVTLGGDLPARPQRAVSADTVRPSGLTGHSSAPAVVDAHRAFAHRVRRERARSGYGIRRDADSLLSGTVRRYRVTANALPHQTIHLLQGVPCVQNLIPRRVQVGRRWSLAALESRLCREIARTGARRRVRA